MKSRKVLIIAEAGVNHNGSIKLAKKLNVVLFSTPFNLRGLNFLKKFNPPIYKVASFEITDLNLINEIAKCKKPIILSTGLSNVSEIKKAIHLLMIPIMECLSTGAAGAQTRRSLGHQSLHP